MSDTEVSPRRAGRAGSDESSTDGDLLVQEGDIAADYLERLLDIVDYDGDIDLDVENDRAVVAIVGSDLQPLVGRNGETLDALQELTRLAVAAAHRRAQPADARRERASPGAAGELSTLAESVARQVLETGEPVRLAAMNPFERKVVHDAISAVDGVRSESEGEEPNAAWSCSSSRDGCAEYAGSACCRPGCLRRTIGPGTSLRDAACYRRR